jgi:methionyl-tRNA synthetase
LPYDVPANAFLALEGRQFSTSRNWAVWLPDVLSRYDADAIRYYLAANMPENSDADFSWASFVSRNNHELVATWGNLAHRALAFAYKHWQGRVPHPGELRPADHELLDQVEQGFAVVGELIEAVKLRAALNEALALARAVNGYLERAPWFRVVATDKTAAATTVYVALRAVDSLKVLLAPFLPFSSERLHQTLGYEQPLFGRQHIATYRESQRCHEALVYDPSGATGRWQASDLQPGQKLLRPSPLYRQLDEAVIAEERGRLGRDLRF